MEIAGYIAAILIGLSLGLLGGGGSILTVPVLVYLFSIDATEATSYSLFIVGAASLVGAIRKYLAGQVNIKTALLFGITSVATVLLVRRYVLTAIPEVIGVVGEKEITRTTVIMVLFAVLMLMASISMIRGRKTSDNTKNNIRVLPLILYGIGIGSVTGLLGAGGGFLLVPALVFIVGLDMKKAVGTSLAIIAMNSLIGFAGDVGQFRFDWFMLLSITGVALAGIFIGIALSKKVEGSQLKKGFGWFVLIMGIFIIMKELL